jgi:DNA-binding NarL/FixJ family response regulator
LETSSIRVLVVDDYEPWRHFVCSTLQMHPEYQIIGEASDGLEAVQKAKDLQPDLIVLDVGLPTLNGIEAARRLHELSPNSQILFLSENRSWDIAQEALSTGAAGYVIKSDAARDLVPAVEAILRGQRFVSARLNVRDLGDPPDPETGYHPVLRHEVTFYTDDRPFLDLLTQFIGSALRIGNGAIVVATESHRTKLLPRLQTYGVDVGASMEHGRLLALDADDALSTFMRDRVPDPALFMKAFGDLIVTALKAAKVKRPRVAIFGECVHLLWEQGNPEAAIQTEKLANKLIRTCAVDILCGYHLGTADAAMGGELFQQICAEHSAVHSL